MDRVVWESRHKFVYYDDETINSLRELECEYPAKINSSEPIVVYIQDEGLPKLDTTLELDGHRIKIFHQHYYELLILLSIIDTIISQMNNAELNNTFERLFRLSSVISKIEIKDMNTFRDLLVESKNMYRDAYVEYMQTGKCDFYDKVPIPFVMINHLVPSIKEAIDLQKYFSLMLEFDGDVSIYTCMAVNDYIASRCNGYLSMNVLLHNNSTWKCYYSNNGQLIEYIHDYTEKDYRKHKIRERNIQN